MGGHGGLNILPQKSWNVYGRDNRERVARDEAKHAAELEEEKRRQLQDARDHRLKVLKDRARGTTDAEGSRAAHQSAAAAEEEDIATGRPQVHINFWGEDEAKTASEDIKAEEAKLEEVRRRGDPARQTSDARFDASFQLANGLQKAARQAWYVQPMAGGGDGQAGANPPLYLGGVSASGSGTLVKTLEGAHKKERRKEKSHKGDKEKKHKKHKRDKDQDGRDAKSRSKSSGGVAKKSTQELREARLQREAAERRRAVEAQIGRRL